MSFGDVFSQSNISIEAKCLNQTVFKNKVNTNLIGEWVGEVDQSQFPCKIKAKTPNDEYYSYVLSADQSVKINPLTSYVIVQATKQLPEDWYASLDQLTDSQLNQANAVVRNELGLKKYDVDSNMNFFTSSYYDLLEELKESVNKSQLFDEHRGLVKLIQQGKVNSIPEAPEDYARLEINYDVCTGVEYQGNTKLLTYCSSNLLPDFTSRKLVQKNKTVCEIKKEGANIIFKSGDQEYTVKINSQAEDKITNSYPIMNTLLLAEDNQRLEFVFTYDLLTMAAAYRLDSDSNQIDVISCQSTI